MWHFEKAFSFTACAAAGVCCLAQHRRHWHEKGQKKGPHMVWNCINPMIDVSKWVFRDMWIFSKFMISGSIFVLFVFQLKNKVMSALLLSWIIMQFRHLTHAEHEEKEFSVCKARKNKRTVVTCTLSHGSAGNLCLVKSHKQSDRSSGGRFLLKCPSS